MPRFRVEHIVSGRTVDLDAPFAALAAQLADWSQEDCRVELLEESPFSNITVLPARVNLERRVVSTKFGDDWRDVLDGVDVHAGDLLELETPNGWRCVRYESSPGPNGKGYVTLYEGERWRKLEAGMKFRWPKSFQS
jgi:hypothetical protein